MENQTLESVKEDHYEMVASVCCSITICTISVLLVGSNRAT